MKDPLEDVQLTESRRGNLVVLGVIVAVVMIAYDWHVATVAIALAVPLLAALRVTLAAAASIAAPGPLTVSVLPEVSPKLKAPALVKFKVVPASARFTLPWKALEPLPSVTAVTLVS